MKTGDSVRLRPQARPAREVMAMSNPACGHEVAHDHDRRRLGRDSRWFDDKGRRESLFHLILGG